MTTTSPHSAESSLAASMPIRTTDQSTMIASSPTPSGDGSFISHDNLFTGAVYVGIELADSWPWILSAIVES
uniref:Uncharacterized protein n=1 Tax=Arundo donax TaxID=35708 RepID=A0A0A8Y134_ARUDO